MIFMKPKKHIQSFLVFTIAILSAAGAARAESLALTGATVYTISGKPIPNGTVLISEGRVTGVGVNISASGFRAIDLSGMNLYPGLIDAASILGLDEISAVRSSVDSREVGDYTPEVASWVSINPDSELIPVARANGIAYSHVMPGGGVIAGQSAVIQSSGWTIEDMATESSAGLVINWPGLSLNVSPNEKKSMKDQDRERKQRVRELNSFFDQAEAYAKARAAASQSVEKVPSWEAMIPFVNSEKPIFVYAAEIRQIKSVIKWAAERSLSRVVLVGGRESWKVSEELATAGMPVVFDTVFSVPGGIERSYDQQYAAPGILSEAGVQIAFGVTGWRGDAASQSRNLPYEAAQAVAFGLNRESALTALTLDAARILGVGESLGSIEIGKVATVIAVDGDILDIRSNVKRMWIEGEEVSLESRHTRLNEKYKNRPR